jgi:hypothetical protein
MITPLNLPLADLKLKRINSVVYVWCIIRKKDLVLTPEEWVRQHVIHFLHFHKNYPLNLIASEYSLTIGTLKRRADLVIMNNQGQPLLMVECKAPEVVINDQVLFQIAQYNSALKLSYLLLTNGLEHHFFKWNQDKFEALEVIPDYKDLI